MHSAASALLCSSKEKQLPQRQGKGRGFFEVSGLRLRKVKKREHRIIVAIEGRGTCDLSGQTNKSKNKKVKFLLTLRFFHFRMICSLYTFHILYYSEKNYHPKDSINNVWSLALWEADARSQV